MRNFIELTIAVSGGRFVFVVSSDPCQSIPLTVSVDIDCIRQMYLFTIQPVHVAWNQIQKSPLAPTSACVTCALRSQFSAARTNLLFFFSRTLAGSETTAESKFSWVAGWNQAAGLCQRRRTSIHSCCRRPPIEPSPCIYRCRHRGHTF